MMNPHAPSRVMSKREIAQLLRRLFSEYRSRFHEQAPQVDAPVPLLVHKRVDVVTVNGGRALHFFFSEPSGGPGEATAEAVAGARQVTRLHDVTLWPPTTRQQKEVAREGPEVQRDLVRRTACIEGALYVHFVLYPEDGDLLDSIGAVGKRLAQREVARFQGVDLPREVPEEFVVAPSGRPDREPSWDPDLDPAP